MKEVQLYHCNVKIQLCTILVWLVCNWKYEEMLGYPIDTI